MNIYSGVKSLPLAKADSSITKGCIILEGGAFRGIYTSGVLDMLMTAGINMSCTVGVSAGAMNGVNYVSGQIGRSARVNLIHRHNSRYVGIQAIPKNKGIIGFDFVFGKMKGVPHFNMARFFKENREFYAVVSSLLDGKAEFIEKNSDTDIFQAVRASASMPFVSRPVMLNSRPYLDGGCCCKIPYQWAIDKGYEKIIVVRTRHEDYRKKDRSQKKHHIENLFYRSYPKFAKALIESNGKYNEQCEELLKLKKSGRIFVISPSEKIEISRLEGDMERLGTIYHLGYDDAESQIDRLKEYLLP